MKRAVLRNISAAYRVERDGKFVTFLDTPGHEAFTAMRARGANLTDVVVLVVAADDGVMPQTIEAMNHAKAAGVTIVIALNKIDLPGVDTNKIYGQLAEHELTPTEWGGNIDVIKTSATTGQGVDELIAHLATLTDLLDLKADPTVPAAGTVIERSAHGHGPADARTRSRGYAQDGRLHRVGSGLWPRPLHARRAWPPRRCGDARDARRGRRIGCSTQCQ